MAEIYIPDQDDQILMQMVSEYDIASEFQDTNPNAQQVIDEVQDFINTQKKPNTVRATKCHLKVVHDWLLVNKFELRPIDQIPPNELNILLAEFFMKVKKSDGKDYEPCSLDSLKGSLERHLREREYPKSIVVDKEFFLNDFEGKKDEA